MSDERSTARIFVQWKGTDVCLDFDCVCSYHAHFHGDFAYSLRCVQCGRIYEMPHTFELTAGPETGVFQEPIGDGHPPPEGLDVVDMEPDPWA
jgi:hypothetical protein